jgi:hypothetical protein
MCRNEAITPTTPRLGRRRGAAWVIVGEMAILRQLFGWIGEDDE